MCWHLLPQPPEQQQHQRQPRSQDAPAERRCPPGSARCGAVQVLPALPGGPPAMPDSPAGWSAQRALHGRQRKGELAHIISLYGGKRCCKCKLRPHHISTIFWALQESGGGGFWVPIPLGQAIMVEGGGGPHLHIRLYGRLSCKRVLRNV